MKAMQKFMQTPVAIIMLLLIGVAITAFIVSYNDPNKNEASYQMSKSASSSADVKTVDPSQKPFNFFEQEIHRSYLGDNRQGLQPGHDLSDPCRHHR